MCIYCGQRILANEGTSGKKSKCPKCSHELRVPWTLKGRPGIGGTKIDTVEDNATDVPKSQDSSPEKTDFYIPGLQNDKPPAFDVVTLYGEKSGWLIPTYDELSLFLIAFTLLLLMIFGTPKQDDETRVSDLVVITAIGYRLLFMCPFFLLGFLLSFYHIFTKRKKTRIEKYLMMFFAVIANAIIGIAAGIYVVRQCPVWQLIFPILNIINCIFILIMLDARILNETCIIERKTTPGRVVIGLITTIVIFALCNYVFKLYWAVTFSVCIIYATNFERALQNVLTSKSNLPNAEPV